MARLCHSLNSQPAGEYNELFLSSRLDGQSYNQLVRENDFGIFWNDHLGGSNNSNLNAGLVIAPKRYDNYDRGIRINELGQVGIGTNNPGTNLEIHKGALKLAGSCGTDGGTRFLIDIDGNQDFMHFKYNGETQLFFDRDGTLKVKKLEVEAQIVPDFVFDKEYDLLSLIELEKYINRHHHLPGIPNEDDIKTNGLDVGEMEMLLLQKVEELTLYTIEQQKQIDKLKNEIEELKNQ